MLTLLTGCSHQGRPADKPQLARLEAEYLRGGDLQKTKVEADRDYRASLPTDSEMAWRFRLLEADIMASQGESVPLLALLNEELPSSLKTSDLAVRQVMLQALAYSHLGQFATARDHFVAAEQLCGNYRCEAGGELARVGGSIALDRDDRLEAQRFYRISLTSAQQRGDRFLEASDLLNLGLVATEQARFDEAVEWLRRASDLSTGIGSRFDAEKSLGNLGWAYYKMGDYDRSLEFSNQAAEAARGLKAEIDEWEWLNNAELVLLERSQFTQAEPGLRRSLQLALQSRNTRQQVEALSGLAFVCLQTGRLKEAGTLAGRASGLADSSGDKLSGFYPMLIQAQVLAREGNPAAAEAVLSQRASMSPEDASIRWQIDGELADIFEEEHSTPKAAAQYRGAIDTLRLARCGIQHEELRMPFLANANRVYDSYIDFLIQHGKTAEALRTADESRALTLAEGLGIGGKSCLAAKSRLDPQRLAKQRSATILFYWLGPRHSYLWAITPARTEVYPLPPFEEIARTAENYRKALLGPSDALDRNNEDGSKLYRVLISPAEKMVQDASRVIVIADSALNGLNFETLLAPAPKPHYWIDDVTVINAPSLRVLQSGPQPASGHRAAGANLLLIGDATSSRSEFRQLANAGTEIEGVERYFSPADRLDFKRERATPQAYLSSHPERFTYIHFVAHGTANLMSPLDSAVVLSQPPDVRGSYKLYARDIIEHPLRAELVTVSTCYGAGARAYTGEGLVGLSWAFLRAGAHNVIGALWEVSDSSTPQLMERMYGELDRGSAPEAALRTAKLSLLHSPGPYRKPYYWAPFQLYTGWSQLRPQKQRKTFP